MGYVKMPALVARPVETACVPRYWVTIRRGVPVLDGGGPRRVSLVPAGGDCLRPEIPGHQAGAEAITISLPWWHFDDELHEILVSFSHRHQSLDVL